MAVLDRLGVLAARGRVDPGALVLRVRGWRALSNFSRLFRLLVRGKLKPLRTILTIRTPAAPAALQGNDG